MTVGYFIGISASFIKGYEANAQNLIASVNQVLGKHHLPAYKEQHPLPDVYEGHMFGHSSLDHDTASSIRDLVQIGLSKRSNSHLQLLVDNPYRVVFIPIPFSTPLVTEHREEIFGQHVFVHAGSSQTLLAELQIIASALGITLYGGQPNDEIVAKINNFEAISPNDEGAITEIRLSWLALFEATRLSIKHNVALSLAG